MGRSISDVRIDRNYPTHTSDANLSLSLACFRSRCAATIRQHSAAAASAAASIPPAAATATSATGARGAFHLYGAVPSVTAAARHRWRCTGLPVSDAAAAVRVCAGPAPAAATVCGRQQSAPTAATHPATKFTVSVCCMGRASWPLSRKRFSKPFW